MAIGNIGGISVKITADIDGFKAGLNRVNAMVDKTSKKLLENSRKYQKWATVGAAAATAVASVMVKTQMKTIDALAKTADRLGLTTQALAGLQRAAVLTGASTSTLDMALQRMTRRVAEAANGTGEAKDAIRELGIDAKALAKLSPDKQFREVADAMAQVSNQGDRVRLSMKLFDSEGVKLVNTLALGSDELDRIEKQAEKFGVALNRVDAAKVEQANDAFFTSSQAVDGVVNRLTVKLSPMLTAIATKFSDAAEESNGFSDSINKTFSGAIKIVGVFANGLHGISVIYSGLEVAAKSMGAVVMASLKTMSIGMEQFINAGVDGLNKIIDSANWFGAGLKPIEHFTFGAAELFTNLSNKANESVTNAIDKFHAKAMEPIPSERLDEWVAEVTAAAEKAAAAATGGSDGSGAGGMSDAEKKALDARIAAIQENLKTERELKAEAYLADLEALNTKRASDLENAAMYDQLEKEMAEKHQSELIAIDEHATNKRVRLAELEAQSKRAAMKTFFSDLASLMNSGSKKAFEFGKKAAVAGAIVDGVRSAVAAWKSGMETGGPYAPLVAAAYTAASLAKTGAMIQQIKSTNYGSAGTGQSFSGGQVVNNAPRQQETQAQQVDVRVTASGGGVVDLFNFEVENGAQPIMTGG